MKKLTLFLLSAVLLFGAAACGNTAKTADGANSDQSASNSSTASPDSSPTASADSSPTASATANSNSAPDKAAQDDATSGVRRAQANSDIRAREQRNNAVNKGGAENRADSDIASELRGKLEVNIPKSKLEVKSEKGAVTVFGAVANQADVAKIDKLAKEIKGVSSVTNHAKVIPAKN